MIIEVKWAEPKGQPEELLLDLDDIAYCNKVVANKEEVHFVQPDGKRGWETVNDTYLHVQLKTGTDLMLADGKRLYDFIKKEKCKITFENIEFIYAYGSEPKQ